MDYSMPLLIVGILILFGGLTASYYNPYEWGYYIVAFIGILITLVGMAFFAMKKE